LSASDIMWSAEARERYADEIEQQNAAARRVTEPPPQDAATDCIDATPPQGDTGPKRKTTQAWQAFNKHFEQNNPKNGQNDEMYKKFTYSEWDEYMYRMDDRGIQGSFDWPKVRWYEWLLAARSREKKEAEEMKEAEGRAEEKKSAADYEAYLEAQRLQEQEAQRQLQFVQKQREEKEAEDRRKYRVYSKQQADQKKEAEAKKDADDKKVQTYCSAPDEEVDVPLPEGQKKRRRHE
jgi:hypothetical protein